HPISVIYDRDRMLATFDRSRDPKIGPNRVKVSRYQRPDTKPDDVLECDHLELQFQNKEIPGAANRDKKSEDLTIESAHATGSDVVLKSDAENFEAHGNDFLFRGNDKEKITVLKGVPEVLVAKDGNLINARQFKTVDVKTGTGTTRTIVAT